MKNKICIVISTYNEDITQELLKSAKKELKKLGNNKIDIIKVPGAFEIPYAISKLIKKYDGFIAIGCVIKGQTANFDLICNAITNGIMQISIDQKKPIGNAVLTLYNKDQAKVRFNRGKEASKAVYEALKIK
tara:strand:- start:1327 stop:1722 length:396 start_codon:yes stop_codon:yes gene_type:complete